MVSFERSSKLTRWWVESSPRGKDRSQRNFEQATRQLLKHFGNDRSCDRIIEAEALTFATHLRQRFASATAVRNIKRCKQLFRFAVKTKLIAKSPFAEIVSGKSRGSSADRRHSITREEVAAVLNACPDHEWRLLVALSRFGGLWIPSEAFALKSRDINLERNRMLVPVPKLEHMGERHATRVVPIFLELLPLLRQQFDAAPDGTEHVILRNRGENLRTQFGRIILQAGLKMWTKLWHAMRASRQTESSASFPLHVVCSWIGNSPEVAQEHYLTVTEQDFDRAATQVNSTNADWQQNRQQYGTETACKASQPKQATPQFSEENEGLQVSATEPIPQGGANMA
jgi:integrase